jgi:hypothetical protein
MWMSRTIAFPLPAAVLLGGLLAGAVHAADAADPKLDLGKWVVDDPAVKVEPYQGRDSLFLDGGTAYLKDVSFEDGTVEVDIGPTSGMAFAGIVFRARSAEDCEVFYVRPFKSGFWDATQYTPRYNGIDAWQLYSGEGFTSEATFAPGSWIHLKLTFEGRTAKAWLDGAKEPVLTMTDLKRDPAPGSVGLWGLFGIHFANFRYTPAPKAAAAAKPVTAAAKPAPEGTISRWELSPVFDAAAVDVDRYPEAGRIAAWEPVTADPAGIVNVAQYRRKTTRLGVVYARAVIHSAKAQVRKLSFGYSDRVTLFLNGVPLFAGDSTWRSRDPSFLGIVRADFDAVFLNLREGDNELLLATTELFGGWGFVARMDTAGEGAPRGTE